MPAGVLEFRRRRSEEERSEVKGVMGETAVMDVKGMGVPFS